MRKAFAAFITSIAFFSASAAENERYYVVPVHISSQCEEDSVGTRLVYKIREAIRRSASMELADSYIKSVVQANIICLVPTEDERGVITRYSREITFMNPKGTYDYALSHAVGECGVQKIDSCAENIAAAIDDAIVDAKAQIADGKFRPLGP